ncbi:MAG TPA: hypothetical protein VM819_02605 [Vicinamibacterales bacterium]|nr:hypothetical protein [Vicinamibacterales bacterium]
MVGASWLLVGAIALSPVGAIWLLAGAIWLLAGSMGADAAGVSLFDISHPIAIAPITAALIARPRPACTSLRKGLCTDQLPDRTDLGRKRRTDSRKGARTDYFLLSGGT